MKLIIQSIFLVALLTMACSIDAKPIDPTLVSNDDPIDDSSDSQTQDDGTTSTTDYKLLFVGNSLTNSNDLPSLVKEDARSKGVKLQTKSIAKPGTAIVDHWEDGEVQELIKSRKYDFVIIQQGPSSQQDGYNMLVYEGKKYADFCKENNAKLAYFMVWPSINYYHTFDGVINNYTAGATANNAILCPVGKVWKDHIDSTDDYSYYGPDGFHPSLKGSKVAAKVIVESLFK